MNGYIIRTQVWIGGTSDNSIEDSFLQLGSSHTDAILNLRRSLTGQLSLGVCNSNSHIGSTNDDGVAVKGSSLGYGDGITVLCIVGIFRNSHTDHRSCTGQKIFAGSQCCRATVKLAGLNQSNVIGGQCLSNQFNGKVAGGNCLNGDSSGRGGTQGISCLTNHCSPGAINVTGCGQHEAQFLAVFHRCRLFNNVGSIANDCDVHSQNVLLQLPGVGVASGLSVSVFALGTTLISGVACANMSVFALIRFSQIGAIGKPMVGMFLAEFLSKSATNGGIRKTAASMNMTTIRNK